MDTRDKDKNISRFLLIVTLILGINIVLFKIASFYFFRSDILDFDFWLGVVLVTYSGYELFEKKKIL
ncbi:hypothetical protein [Granulicatella seriolae]|jgi:hypothetical protein|uniref:CPBP family intramembrane metalloprotease n=1 Tax=Granulicatella seriolae TaxID=2967226 RepID=A0ABT1WP72_9LACT|nr:hypothetical protein [Granulicatella seriolae]